MMKNKLYLVKYCGGSYEDSYEKEVFVTSVKSKAIKYCQKFNKILSKWRDYYSEYEADLPWLCYKRESPYRCKSLEKYQECYWIEIELR